MKTSREILLYIKDRGDHLVNYPRFYGPPPAVEMQLLQLVSLLDFITGRDENRGQAPSTRLAHFCRRVGDDVFASALLSDQISEDLFHQRIKEWWNAEACYG